MLNPKSETLNPKQTQNSKLKIQNILFEKFGFWALDLFRVSGLEFRVYATILLFVICFLLTSLSLADTVYLASGEAVKGLVVEEHHDRIVFSTYKGEITLPKFSIDQIFFDDEEKNYTYLGDKAFDEGAFELALGFYQKAYQINPEFERLKGAFLRLVDAINRKKLKIQRQEMPIKLKEQLGITIERFKDKIRVVSVSKDSFAEKVGISAGDFITDDWDISIMYMDAESAAEIMIGVPGTPVRLSIEKNISLPVKITSWWARIFHLTRFTGLGFNLSLRPTGLIVAHVKPQSQAEKNGLKAADAVTHINGESTRYMPASLAKRKIFYSNLNQINLTIKRQVVLIRK